SPPENADGEDDSPAGGFVLQLNMEQSTHQQASTSRQQGEQASSPSGANRSAPASSALAVVPPPSARGHLKVFWDAFLASGAKALQEEYSPTESDVEAEKGRDARMFFRIVRTRSGSGDLEPGRIVRDSSRPTITDSDEFFLEVAQSDGRMTKGTSASSAGRVVERRCVLEYDESS
ncbi:unnamed protein product, partial [Amoebophrya sp. A120]